MNSKHTILCTFLLVSTCTLLAMDSDPFLDAINKLEDSSTKLSDNKSLLALVVQQKELQEQLQKKLSLEEEKLLLKWEQEETDEQNLRFNDRVSLPHNMIEVRIITPEKKSIPLQINRNLSPVHAAKILSVKTGLKLNLDAKKITVALDDNPLSNNKTGTIADLILRSNKFTLQIDSLPTSESQKQDQHIIRCEPQLAKHIKTQLSLTIEIQMKFFTSRNTKEEWYQKKGSTLSSYHYEIMNHLKTYHEDVSKAQASLNAKYTNLKTIRAVLEKIAFRYSCVAKIPALATSAQNHATDTLNFKKNVQLTIADLELQLKTSTSTDVSDYPDEIADIEDLVKILEDK